MKELREGMESRHRRRLFVVLTRGRRSTVEQCTGWPWHWLSTVVSTVSRRLSRTGDEKFCLGLVHEQTLHVCHDGLLHAQPTATTHRAAKQTQLSRAKQRRRKRALFVLATVLGSGTQNPPLYTGLGCSVLYKHILLHTEVKHIPRW